MDSARLQMRKRETGDWRDEAGWFARKVHSRWGITACVGLENGIV